MSTSSLSVASGRDDSARPGGPGRALSFPLRGQGTVLVDDDGGLVQTDLGGENGLTATDRRQ